MSLQAMRERRNSLVQEAKNLNAQHTGSWPADVAAKYDAIIGEVGQIDDNILRQQKVLDLEAENKFGDFMKQVGGKESEAKGSQYAAYLRNGAMPEIRNTMSVGGAGSEGGYTVQTEVAKHVLNALKAYGGMRQVAQIIQTEQGNPMNYPTSDGTSEIGEIIGENSTATALDASFGTLPLNVYKYSSKVITVPFELLQDSAIDVEGFVNDRIVTRLGRIQNAHFTTGTGSGQPNGVVTAATVGKTGASGQTLTVLVDDLIDLQHSVDPLYRSNGKFMMHDSTVKVIRKLKDSNGRPLWVPDFDGGITNGMGGTLLGSQVVINQQMPVMAANARSIAFGDFSYYKIRDVMAMSMFRFTDSVYTTKGQVGFLAWARSGANLIDVGGAIKLYVNSAT